METVKELLEKYKTIVSEVKSYEWAIKNEKRREIDIPISRLSDMPHKTGYIENNASKQIDDKNDKIKDYEIKLDLLQQKLDIIHDLVNILKDSNRTIIVMFYFNGNSLQDIYNHFELQGRHREIISIQEAKKRSIDLMQNELDLWRRRL